MNSNGSIPKLKHKTLNNVVIYKSLQLKVWKDKWPNTKAEIVNAFKKLNQKNNKSNKMSLKYFYS